MSERTTLTANALASGRHWRQTDPSSSGGVVGVERELDELFAPEGHVSGSPSETSTFLNTDLASIGMFGATYTGVRPLIATEVKARARSSACFAATNVQRCATTSAK